MEPSTYKIDIEGVVQGVGFRPFVFSLAHRLNLKGDVCNTTYGACIRLNATKEQFDNFLNQLQKDIPPLASINNIKVKTIKYKQFKDFAIIQSDAIGKKVATIPPDISICQECEKELFDKNNRRYKYPFITCTNCGVRYSIIYSLPYDRKNTSMKFFKMCKKCQEEYNNPLDRRYHAQPIGCFECGPRLELYLDDKRLDIEQKFIIDKTAQILKEGKILALKGVGGFHLMCDATDEEAILKLRERKKRPTKPLAVMVRDIKQAKKLAFISKKEQELLLSQERPIVILKSRKNLKHIAPGLDYIGIFLPYTPLHVLLLDIINKPLVATSANISNEPICTTFKDIKRLKGVYDAILDHNREIVNVCDDSVLMVVGEKTIVLRGARGYAPINIKLPFRLENDTLGFGANQKSTVAIGFDDKIVASGYIGDLHSIESISHYKKTLDRLVDIYNFNPTVMAYDKHPYYESTKLAKNMIKDKNKASKSVQHHYAHILSVMAEKNITGKVFGVAFDGTGYGDDGNLWGGEFLVCDYKGYDRIFHFSYFKLLGGEKAIKEPRRVALSLLFEIFNEDTLKLKNHTTLSFSKTELKNHYIAWKRSLNSPLTSSVGRVFDAVASLLGISQTISYEGESGMLLERYYDSKVTKSYPYIIKDTTIDILPMIKKILEEKDRTIAVSKFFNTLVDIIDTLYKPYISLPLVVSGGVFQNRVLLELLFKRFENIIISDKLPPNDSSIAIGQIVAKI